MKKETEIKFMFAVVTDDTAGQTIQLFKTKKQAEMFYKIIVTQNSKKTQK